MILIKEDKLITRISIIIPTLNESNNLPLILSDLSEINNISEILIIDSTSTDKSWVPVEVTDPNFKKRCWGLHRINLLP